MRVSVHNVSVTSVMLVEKNLFASSDGSCWPTLRFCPGAAVEWENQRIQENPFPLSLPNQFEDDKALVPLYNCYTMPIQIKEKEKKVSGKGKGP